MCERMILDEYSRMVRLLEFKPYISIFHVFYNYLNSYNHVVFNVLSCGCGKVILALDDHTVLSCKRCMTTAYGIKKIKLKSASPQVIAGLSTKYNVNNPDEVLDQFRSLKIVNNLIWINPDSGDIIEYKGVGGDCRKYSSYSANMERIMGELYAPKTVFLGINYDLRLMYH